jgi:L-asparaginase
MANESILILYAGGTIGMVPGASGLEPSAAFIDTVDAWMHSEQAQHGGRYLVEAIDPLIDSANAEPATWYAIARRILDRRHEFDAAVLLHGTDTLAYTASALSFLLRGLARPIVVTGAQVSYALPNSDAEPNVRGALACAREPHIREVCVYFGGKLTRGNRTRKWSTLDDEGFFSPHWPELGQLDHGLHLQAEALLHVEPAPVAPIPPRPPGISAGLVKLYPGISDRLIAAAADAHPDGLVLELYGSGTGPAASRAIRNTLRIIAARGTPLIGVSQVSHGRVTQERYAAGAVLAECGVANGHDLTPEAALTKLIWLQCDGPPAAHLTDAMASPVAGELTLPAIECA